MNPRPRTFRWRTISGFFAATAGKSRAFVAGIVLATLIVACGSRPVYESTATVDIDRQMPTGVLGQEALQNATNDADQFLATQVKLIQSDSVLRPVVDKYHLRDVEKDALEEAIDKSPTSLEAPVILKESESHAATEYLFALDLLSIAKSPARRATSPMKSRFPISPHTYRIRYKATASLSDFMERQLEELKAQMEKSSEALCQLRARTQRHQPRGENQHPLRAPAPTQ